MVNLPKSNSGLTRFKIIQKLHSPSLSETNLERYTRQIEGIAKYNSIINKKVELKTKELIKEIESLQDRIKNLIQEKEKLIEEANTYKLDKDSIQEELNKIQAALNETVDKKNQIEKQFLEKNPSNYKDELYNMYNKLDDTTRKLFIIASALGVSLGGNVYYMFRGSPNKDVSKNDLENKNISKKKLEDKNISKAELEKELRSIYK